MKPVEALPCANDEVCPHGGAVVLNRQSFLNLMENLENYEAYIKQLEEIIKGISK
jgi:hypothetical protein